MLSGDHVGHVTCSSDCKNSYLHNQSDISSTTLQCGAFYFLCFNSLRQWEFPDSIRSYFKNEIYINKMSWYS